MADDVFTPQTSLVRFIKDSFTFTVLRRESSRGRLGLFFFYFFPFPRMIEPHVNWLLHMNRVCITLALCHCQIRGYGSSTRGEPFTVKQSYVTAASGLCAISVVILPRWGCQGRSFNKAVNLWMCWPLTLSLLALEQFTPSFSPRGMCFDGAGMTLFFNQCRLFLTLFFICLFVFSVATVKIIFPRHENNRLHHNCICSSDLHTCQRTLAACSPTRSDAWHI